MGKIHTTIIAGFLAIALFTGCHVSYTGGTRSEACVPTVGQQLTDLQKAKDSGAITDSEYQAQKAKILSQK